jgi:hypothetical protein
MKKENTRGGYRPKAGRKSKWKSGKTKVIRLPEALISQIMKLAHAIDKGEKVTKSAKPNNNQNLRKAADRYLMTLPRREKQEAMKWINRFLKTLT